MGKVLFPTAVNREWEGRSNAVDATDKPDGEEVQPEK
jgi:hypothetical protein